VRQYIDGDLFLFFGYAAIELRAARNGFFEGREVDVDAVSDGIFFSKDDGDTNLDFRVEKDGTETATAAVATVADDTFITATWFIDPDRDAVYYSINNAEPVKIVNTNLRNNFMYKSWL